MPILASRAVLLPDGSLRPGVIEIKGTDVVGFTPAASPGSELPDTVVAPGFIDLQVNGHDDVDVSVAAGAGWERMDDLLLRQGVTSWCPTLVTSPPESYGPALLRVAEAARRSVCGAPGGAPSIPGAHLEGPFLGALPGAHDRRWFRLPDPEWLAGLPAVVAVVTLAPELPGALDLVRTLAEAGVLVSLGHSTATWAEAVAAAEAGARMVTHLFNAATPLHHREPGLVGAGLTDSRLTPSLIADLVHLHPAVLASAFRCRQGLAADGDGEAAGDPGVALVTDAVAWRAEHLAGGRLHRRAGDAPRRADGTIAGSALTMDAAVRNAVSAGVALPLALAAASRVPARLLGATDRGLIRTGSRADLVVLDARLEVTASWVGGAPAWER